MKTARYEEPGTDQFAPHSLANELTDDPAVQTDECVSSSDQPSDGPGQQSQPIQARSEPQPDDRALTQAQKHIGRQMAVVICGVAVIATVLSAALLRQWTLLGLGVILILPFMILLLAPVWLATTTKTAQDDSVKQQRGEDESPRQG